MSEQISNGDAAYTAILRAIREGDYGPGDRLRETEIAERVGLSRTPIREALRKLESDGIVEHRPRVGSVVRQLGHSEVVELYEIRLVLERTAAELAAKHAVDAQIAELEAINRAIGKSLADPPAAAALNQQFHQTLYRTARNRFLLEAASSLNNALMLLGPTTLADEERISTVCRQHQQIIDGVRRADKEAAGTAAEAHLQGSLRHRLSLMRS
ncbi:MAG: GntR family transcriptional regulator [Pseudomonadota bacterium]